jgi:hypothetical protein
LSEPAAARSSGTTALASDHDEGRDYEVFRVDAALDERLETIAIEHRRGVERCARWGRDPDPVVATNDVVLRQEPGAVHDNAGWRRDSAVLLDDHVHVIDDWRLRLNRRCRTIVSTARRPMPSRSSRSLLVTPWRVSSSAANALSSIAMSEALRCEPGGRRR